MAHHLSAEKRTRQSVKRSERNRHIKTTMRGHIKRLRESIEKGDLAESAKMLQICVKQIDRAVSKGVYHRKTGSRYISRLSARVAALQTLANTAG
ncbi:MAG: 30S ribosomal protein S20 [Deltaproteobacteria bacterium]|nr:30S ribosomal protein S20 [Deltaproteobacteria bacterium]